MVRVCLAQLLEASWAGCLVIVNVWPSALASGPRVVGRGLPLTLAAGYAFARPRRESGRSPFASPVVVSGVFFVGRDVEALEFAPASFFPFAPLTFEERLRGLRQNSKQLSEVRGHLPEP